MKDALPPKRRNSKKSLILVLASWSFSHNSHLQSFAKKIGSFEQKNPVFFKVKIISSAASLKTRQLTWSLRPCHPPLTPPGESAGPHLQVNRRINQPFCLWQRLATKMLEIQDSAFDE